MKTFKIVTQNCFCTIPKKLIRKLIIAENADFFCFQEVTSKRFVNKILPEKYYWASSEPVKALHLLHFHNVILTKFPIIKSGEFLFEKSKKIGFDPFAGKAFWVEVKFGTSRLKIYNCHFSPFGQGIEDRSNMLKLIIRDAIKFVGSVVICGDMNTVIPSNKIYRKFTRIWNKFPLPRPDILGDFANANEKYFFIKTANGLGFNEIADIQENTWKMLFIGKKMQMKLDWMLYRKLKPKSYKLGPWIGDHRSIIAELNF
jgi:endonuclease/exonuclease/phosphatase family metal-dependent hydrolase